MKKQNGRKVKRLRWNRSFVVVASVLVLAIGLVGTTLAYLFDKTDAVTNTFIPSNVTTTIEEGPEDKTKNDVKVTNTGNIDAYIRAMVVVTWQNDEGQVYPAAPVKGTDYQVTYKTEANDAWFEKDGYYYHKAPVTAGNSTSILLTDCKPIGAVPDDDYHLVVEILSDAIQAQPESAVIGAWGVSVNPDGTLSVSGN